MVELIEYITKMKSIKKTIVALVKIKGRHLLALMVLLAMPVFSGCTSQSQSYSVNLEIWGIFDESAIYSDVIVKYKDLNPYIKEIKYRKFSQETYKQELLDALASGQGPDIFLINNSWLPSFKNKLEPASQPLFNDQDMKANFPDVVSFDFMDEGKIYATPLSVDSLQLYYNKDIFNAAGIVAPPKTWQEFSNYVQKLTIVDSVGNILRSGGAIGTAQNISQSADLLSLLLLQNGAELPTKNGVMTRLDQGEIGQDGNVVQAGEQALGYYTQFAKVSMSSNIANPLYSWNSRQRNSMDAFAGGSVAMMVNYSWQGANIKSKNPKLNFAVAPVPQVNLDKPLTVANYWGYAVAKNKINSSADVLVANEVRTHEAWQFLRFLTLKNSGVVTLYNAITKKSKDFPISYDPALEYLKKTQQPAARRDIIESQKIDTTLGVFATGNLIARSWYQIDPDNAEKIFADAIDSVGSGGTSLRQSISLMTNRLNYLMQAKK